MLPHVEQHNLVTFSTKSKSEKRAIDFEKTTLRQIYLKPHEWLHLKYGIEKLNELLCSNVEFSRRETQLRLEITMNDINSRPHADRIKFVCQTQMQKGNIFASNKEQMTIVVNIIQNRSTKTSAPTLSENPSLPQFSHTYHDSASHSVPDLSLGQAGSPSLVAMGLGADHSGGGGERLANFTTSTQQSQFPVNTQGGSIPMSSRGQYNPTAAKRTGSGQSMRGSPTWQDQSHSLSGGGVSRSSRPSEGSTDDVLHTTLGGKEMPNENNGSPPSTSYYMNIKTGGGPQGREMPLPYDVLGVSMDNSSMMTSGMATRPAGRSRSALSLKEEEERVVPLEGVEGKGRQRTESYTESYTRTPPSSGPTRANCPSVSETTSGFHLRRRGSMPTNINEFTGGGAGHVQPGSSPDQPTYKPSSPPVPSSPLTGKAGGNPPSVALERGTSLPNVVPQPINVYGNQPSFPCHAPSLPSPPQPYAGPASPLPHVPRRNTGMGIPYRDQNSYGLQNYLVQANRVGSNEFPPPITQQPPVPTGVHRPSVGAVGATLPTPRFEQESPDLGNTPATNQSHSVGLSPNPFPHTAASSKLSNISLVSQTSQYGNTQPPPPSSVFGVPPVQQELTSRVRMDADCIERCSWFLNIPAILEDPKSKERRRHLTESLLADRREGAWLLRRHYIGPDYNDHAYIITM
eukprot:Ihof_evm4s447 gene=Ihof_evmTU4s447